MSVVWNEFDSSGLSEKSFVKQKFQCNFIFASLKVCLSS